MLRGDSLFTFITNNFSAMFPPKPVFTEKDIEDLSGKVSENQLSEIMAAVDETDVSSKVYIVTGANTGIGKEVARILYSKHATVYCAARNEEKASKAIDDIKAGCSGSRGQLTFLHLDLADLSTIRATAEAFLAREEKLHVLINNAGVMFPPQGSKTPQGYELHLGVNNVGTFLLTKLLTPILVRTARAETDSPAAVRVVWVASSAAEAPIVPVGGLDLANLDYHNDKDPFHKYAVSKAGNYLHGTEFARRHLDDGVVSIPLNPGNLESDLWRALPAVVQTALRYLVLHPTVHGAYTELFAALSPEVTLEKSGEWGEHFS